MHSNYVKLEHKHGDASWKLAVKTEIELNQYYKTWKNLFKDDKPPEGCKIILARFAFDTKKNDVRNEDTLVADENLIEMPLLSVYSGVVSLWRIRLFIFLTWLNGMHS